MEKDLEEPGYVFCAVGTNLGPQGSGQAFSTTQLNSQPQSEEVDLRIS